MPKRLIEFRECGVYHIFNRSQGRITVFVGIKEYFHFASRLLYLADCMDIELLAWCLLPNHFHLLLKQKGDSSISKFMQRLQLGFAKRFNFLTKKTGHVFEKRFGARGVTSEGYQETLFRYIVNNPVHHNLVDNARDWPFSNYGELISNFHFTKFIDEEDEFGSLNTSKDA